MRQQSAPASLTHIGGRPAVRSRRFRGEAATRSIAESDDARNAAPPAKQTTATTEPSDPVAGLAKKRAEIVAQIAETRAMLRELFGGLEHVDAAIRLFDKTYAAGAVTPEICGAGQVTYRGELARSVLNLLRETPDPLTTREITLHIMAERGKNTASNAVVKVMTGRTEALLRDYRDRGAVRSIKDPQAKLDLWELTV